MISPNDPSNDQYKIGYEKALQDVQEIILDAGSSINDSFSLDVINGSIQKIQSLKSRFQKPRGYETKDLG